MSSPLSEIRSSGDAQAVIDVAMDAAGTQPVDESFRFHTAVVPAGGKVEVIDLEQHLEQFRDRPRRKKGLYTVTDAGSFVAYLEKHALPETEVWADVERSKVTAVINAHAADSVEDATAADRGANWEDHRLGFSVKHTDAWKAWAKYDGTLLDQSTFAEHIEDRAIDIIRPAAADMLELAETFQANIGVQFESSKALSSGERQFEYREQVDAKAGRRGHLEIPKDFDIAVRPFEGADVYKVLARFRYRITDGVLRIGYKLERPTDVLREAFLGVVSEIEGSVEAPVYRGSLG